MVKPIAPRGLADRSKLEFWFPRSEPNNFTKVNLYFLENIRLVESKRAKLAKLSPIGRNHNIFAHFGADSREFTLSFNLTLNHILDMDVPGQVQSNIAFLSEDKEKEKRKFKETLTAFSGERGPSQTLLAVSYFKAITGISFSDPSNLFNDFISNTVLPFLRGDNNTNTTNQFNQVEEEERIRSRILDSDDIIKKMDLILFWINIIRASVSNNQQQTHLGPPIIRLYHGMMYNNIPCVCENYTMTPNQEAGYDLATLLPRQLQVNLKLHEVRNYNVEDFAPGSIVTGDNAAGWEAVFDHATMDPYDENIWEDNI
jgi:hypothetical protein